METNVTESSLASAMTELWKKTQNNEPNYVLVDGEISTLLTDWAAYYEKWYVQLFSPLGLAMLFPALSNKVKA